MSANANAHPRVKAAGAVISDHLNEIATLYNREMKLTLLVRDPSAPDGSRDMVLTSDKLTEAIQALSIREKAERQ